MAAILSNGVAGEVRSVRHDMPAQADVDSPAFFPSVVENALSRSS
jgi:hypothetical protein